MGKLDQMKLLTRQREECFTDDKLKYNESYTNFRKKKKIGTYNRKIS